MTQFKWLLMIGALGLAFWTIPSGLCADYQIYSVQRGLNMGNPGEVTQTDYYVTMGTSDGIRKGSVLEVNRKAPSYDLMSEKLYQDVIFPIAQLKVIHVENRVAIARLEKMLPTDQTPTSIPQAVIVGDLVRAVK